MLHKIIFLESVSDIEKESVMDFIKKWQDNSDKISILYVRFNWKAKGNTYPEKSYGCFS